MAMKEGRTVHSGEKSEAIKMVCFSGRKNFMKRTLHTPKKYGKSLLVLSAFILAGSLSIAAVVKGAGLTSTNVQPMNMETGRTSQNTISFTTVGAIPADGKIKVTYPSGFNVSGASGGTCATMDGTFVTSVSGQTVTLTRQNDGTSQSSGSETCTINGIQNPAVAGSAGTYTIETTNAADVQIDIDPSVAADSIVAALMTSTNVEPASLVAGTTNTVTVTFTTVNAIPNNGRIRVTFPGGFNVSGASGGTCSSMDGGFTTSVTGQEVTIARNSAGTSEPAGAQTCTMNGITNPGSAGSTGTYSLQSTNSSGQLIDTATVSADTITAATPTLTSTNVQPASLNTGATSVVTLSFTTTNNIPANGKIAVQFPSGFVVTGATGGTCSSMDGTFVTSISGQRVTITRQNDGSLQAGGSAETCTVSGIQNPTTASSTGTYSLATLTSTDSVIDTDTGVTADTIVASTLTSTNVEPTSLVASANGTVTVTFTTINSLPNNGRVRVTFPAGFNVSGASGATCSSMDGGFTTSVSGQEVTITRNGAGSPEAPGPQTCTINSITNPGSAGSTGTYTITTLTGASQTIDNDSAVSADTITSATGALASTNVQPASLAAGATGAVTASFTTQNAIPANGKIAIEFPAGFDITGATGGTCSSMDGTFVTSISGQRVTITRQNDGSLQAGGSAETCTVSGIKNPSTAGTTGTYSLATFTSADSMIDSELAVSADTLVAATLTSPAVTPSLVRPRVSTLVTIAFTTQNSIANNGKIKVTFPSGFTVSGATSGTCSTMDGAFATSVSGQTVTLTRSGGSSEVPGAQVCTVSGITNPTTRGTTGTYAIQTTTAADVLHDEATAVAGTVITGGDDSGGGTQTPQVYAMSITAPLGGSFTAGEIIPITWTTQGSTTTPGFVTLSYSIDAGTFWKTIAQNTPNDGEYRWSAPEEQADAVIIKAEATDLASVLASDLSEALSIATENDEQEVQDGAEEGEGEDEQQDEEGDQEQAIEEMVEKKSDDVITTRAELEPGMIVREQSERGVFYLDTLGTKRPFLNEQIFFTYLSSFDDVQVVADGLLAAYPEGTLVPPKAGTVLVKLQTQPEVYALENRDGIVRLRWIASESVARVIYGASWGEYVLDIVESIFMNLGQGEVIDDAGDVTEPQNDMMKRSELGG
jgi:hypothetical protein